MLKFVVLRPVVDIPLYSTEQKVNNATFCSRLIGPGKQQL
jgi:hypothetical protein